VVDYQSLYRRYRPQRFEEVRGQDHVVKALRHAVRDDRVAHAYLFSGPRGTGKTSTARILAKALNCANPSEGEPCGVCESCVDITRGASFDVHELDAASNNGVEAMRDLVARASLATPGRWKVYIVDEVHMLSQSASNALLKTLEEPPDHVVFVLATTDPQKVLPTIRSRTQHYEFHLLDAEVLALLLADIARDAKLELPETAVEAAVRRGRGSARDALSALDQVVASGIVDDDGPFVHELLVSLAERDTARALLAVEQALVAGRDAPRVAAGLLDELRGQFLSTMAPGLSRAGEPIATPPPPVSAQSAPRSGLLLGPARSVRAMEVLGTAMVAMRDSLDARVTLEVAIVRLTHPEADDDPGALLERIERLERRVQELNGPPGTAPHSTPPPAPPPQVPAPPAAAPSPSPPGAAAQAPEATPTTSKSEPPAAVHTDLESRPALGAFAPAASAPGVAEQAPVRPSQAEASPASDNNMAAPPQVSAPPPTRDELVEAWGDHVLNQLRPRVRAVFAVGRFLASDGETATLALPNSAHVERASADCEEVARALGSYFGRPVHLRLVSETDLGASHSSAGPVGAGRRAVDPGAGTYGATGSGAPPIAEMSGAAASEDPDDLDPLGEQVPGDAVSWAQERLMQVFPGAEEV